MLKVSFQNTSTTLAPNLMLLGDKGRSVYRGFLPGLLRLPVEEDNLMTDIRMEQ